MTNSEKVLETWNSLKTKLSKLIYLNKNKGLIKDALEIYLNSTSTFFSPHNALDMPFDWQITLLTEPTVPEYDSTTNLRSQE